MKREWVRRALVTRLDHYVLQGTLGRDEQRELLTELHAWSRCLQAAGLPSSFGFPQVLVTEHPGLRALEVMELDAACAGGFHREVRALSEAWIERAA